jgi:hypothetical protein
MGAIIQNTDHWNALRVHKGSLILEVQEAVVNKCSADILQQFDGNLQLVQNGFQKQHQRNLEALKSIQSQLRDHRAFQSGVSVQLNQLEDRMNMMDVDIICVQKDTKGLFHSGI